MKYQRIVCVIVLLLLSASCATTSLPETDASMCARLGGYASTLAPGSSGTIRLARGGQWMVDHYKTCESPIDDSPGQELCEWLFENTSTEFMEANVVRALSCLQRQTIRGYVGNTTLEAWSGTASFNRTVFPNSEASIVVTWQVGCPQCNEDFLLFEFSAPEE